MEKCKKKDGGKYEKSENREVMKDEREKGERGECKGRREEKDEKAIHGRSKGAEGMQKKEQE